MRIRLILFIVTLMFLSCNNEEKESQKIKKLNIVIPIEPEKTLETGEEWFNKALGERDTQLQIMYYTYAIKFGPDNFNNYCSAINNRGNAKKNLSDFRGAIDDFDLCILSCPDMSVSYSSRGECKMQLGDIKGAVKDFDVTINSNLQDIFKLNAYMNKGICLLNAHDKEGACKNWSIAGQMGSGDAYDYIKQYCK